MEINRFTRYYLTPILKKWRDDRKEEGLIPTLDLLIEDLEGKKEETVEDMMDDDSNADMLGDYIDSINEENEQLTAYAHE